MNNKLIMLWFIHKKWNLMLYACLESGLGDYMWDYLDFVA